MKTDQIKWVVVDPDGVIKGPVGQTKEEVEMYLCGEHQRAGLSGRLSDIYAAGYSVHKVRMVFLDD